MIECGDPLRVAASGENELLWKAEFVNRWMPPEASELLRPTPVAIATQAFPGAAPSPHITWLRDALLAGRGARTMTNFCIRLAGATLVGERALIPASMPVVITDSSHPYHTAEIFRHDGRRHFEHVQLGYDGTVFSPAYSAADTVHCSGSVALLSGMEQNNYGAFLLRILPKLAAVQHLGIKPEKYIVAAGHPWQTKLLEIFGVQADQIIPYDLRKTYSFDELYVPDMQTSEFVPNDLTIDFFESVKRPILEKKYFLPGSKKIYISRLRQARERPHYRVCLNEAELVSRLEALGFEIYEPEGDTPEDQIRTFAAARLIVGGSGAAMFNTVFSPPQTRVLSIEPMMDWVVLHANLYAGWGHPYAMILGGADPSDEAPQKRWLADIDLVVDTLAKLD